MPRNLKLLIEYDGTNYAGWQAQENALAVQTVIERTLERLVRHKVQLTGAGRTDAGVHAEGQVANFRTDSPIPCDGLRRAANDLLPLDITILDAVDVPETFHARFDATARTYRYTLLNRRNPSAILGRFAWHVERPLPVPVWDALCREMVGTQDFSAFRKAGSARLSPVCTVFDGRCWNAGDFVYVSITADSFLRGMMRAFVGTAMRVAPDASTDPDDALRAFRRVILSRNRSEAGESVPARGLCLTRVSYEPIQPALAASAELPSDGGTGDGGTGSRCA
jgi:tRNA pseudouridine38-40 synthase